MSGKSANPRSATGAARPAIALSFDIECYYQIAAKDYLGRSIEPTHEVLTNTNWILDLLAEHGAKATFFFLGNVAERYPELVRRAVAAGHEIGVHGDVHDYVRDMDPPQFRAEIGRAMAKIRAAGAETISGHRATAFSITRDNLWALDTLKELGLRYDSSIFPFAGARYGIADWPRRPEMTQAGVFEIPMSVVELGRQRLPCMGGGYVRYFPFAYTQWCARQLHREGLTPVCYFHPYEFEQRLPRFSDEEIKGATADQLRRLRRVNFMQGIGRGAPMRRKLERLVRNFDTVPLGALVH